MTNLEIYALIFSLVVLVMLVGVFSYMLTIMIKQGLKHIKAGLDDEEILKEFNNENGKRQGKFSKAFNVVLNVFLCVFFGVLFSSSLYINCTQNVYFENLPTYRVVLTSSMEEKNEKNQYLFDNNINNQIGAFDLIATYKIPKEEDLKLYDIVVYEVDGMLVVHRIVGIEEPNQNHPNERQFLLQGDAISSPDRFPVLYSQMKGIYRGEKIPFVGTFVLFMQSPAGWICIFLVFVALILTPILENKLLKTRKARYLLLAKEQELATSQTDVQELPASPIIIRKTDKTFEERLLLASQEMQERYNEVVNLLLRIEGIRLIESKEQRSYKNKANPIARLLFRGKTLNVCLGLNPKEYENTKYIFTDISQSSKHKNYPMRLKLTSKRQTRWTCDLIMELAQKLGLKIMEKPVETINENFSFDNLKNKLISKSFVEKLEINPVANQRFLDISSLLNRVDNVRVIESKKARTYKCGSRALAKFMVKGKTLNTYIALNPDEYESTKYIFTNESMTRSHLNYPMRVKVTSDRQQRWVKELLIQKINKEGLTLLQEERVIDTTAAFERLKNIKTSKSFKQKLKLYKVAKERFSEIKLDLEKLKNIRAIESKYGVTYKIKNLSVVKFLIKGKTLNAYLNLEPSKYENSKYIYTDVSNVKKYTNYPMRVKVSSNRQVKWVKELISQIIK